MDHVLRSNLFPLQHIVQRRGTILEALFRISVGFWFDPRDLIMSALFHFEEKVHIKNLSNVKAKPLLFCSCSPMSWSTLAFPLSHIMSVVVIVRPPSHSRSGNLWLEALLFLHLLLLRRISRKFPRRYTRTLLLLLPLPRTLTDLCH